MTLQPRDLHFLFARGPNRLKAFDATGKPLLDVEARNRTTADGQLGHNGNCPPGTYILEPPIPKNTVPFGPWFVGLTDWAECHEMALHGRSGIGLHGGGSGLDRPFAPRQSPPWIPTHGCLRLRNVDLEAVVHLVRGAQQQGGTCYITVEEPVPVLPGGEPDDDTLDIPEDQLFPDE